MTPEGWQRIDQLFHAALLRQPAQRAAFLTAQCAGDESLRREVESLLSSAEEAQDFIEAPPGELAAEMLGTREAAFQPGHQIENYRIVRQLGAGGMGEVYLADDLRLNRNVALKLLPPHFTVNPERVRRFEREARAASALNHPNIVTVYEIRKSAAAHFIATEFVDGRTLRQLINEKPLTLGEALNVVIQVADALKGAHAAGIVHRDVKPENIMVRSDGYVKILDFGLAKLTESHPTDRELEAPTLLKSNPGLIMGTVQYMSPEQARGRSVDARTDIWSLGIVLYELLVGRVPFAGETPSHVMVSLMEDDLPPLTDNENVPAALDRIVTKTLRKRPGERYQKASQLASELKHLKEELRIEQRLTRILEAVPNRDTVASAPSLDSVAKRKLALPILILVGLIAASIGGYILLKFRGRVGPKDAARSGLNAELISIPGGNFIMGRDDALPTEAPAHLIHVSSFDMDKTEVTNGEYAEFVMQTKHAPPEKWGAIRPPAGQERLPVSDVSYEDAVAFAQWRSKRDGVTYRLPTEKEWEYAARNGDQNNFYPWGDSWESQRAVTLENAAGREQPVGNYPLGANRWGVQDLIGNVWEWTSSKANLYEGSRLAPIPPQHQDWIVVRGGGWRSPTAKLSATMRDWFAPHYRNRMIGFRLVIGRDYALDSLAVLPFGVSPYDASTRKLADSFSENVINSLSERFGPRVPPFSAVSRYHDQTNIFDIGRELGVRGVAVGQIHINPKPPGTVYLGDEIRIEIKVFDVRDNKELDGNILGSNKNGVDWLETMTVRELSKKLRVSDDDQK